jgi:nitrogen-specific signal transduction histidine kinase
MELLLECAQPALTDASDRLIDLVDRVMKRHTAKAKPRRNLFSFLKRDRPLVRPSLDRPSQKIVETPSLPT